ncbi:MAG TPA: PepSY domain-containing protein [Thermoanaerobaculia bacterium]|nr:PepSY domain-containing protein [Thermoanaerobaculia bacterium]
MKAFAAAALLALLVAPATMNAKTTPESQAKLEKEAKISMHEAREIALKNVHKGSKIESAEIEREHGKLIYSFDIRETGRKDVTEVNVDAMTGKIVAIDHENPKKEAAEKKQEAKEKH